MVKYSDISAMVFSVNNLKYSVAKIVNINNALVESQIIINDLKEGLWTYLFRKL